ncbi:MAG: hypothetical protein V4520_16220 [Bacteroidota bacterium]
MTFIASVRAKDGVAIIADSLVTTVRPILEAKDFNNYLAKIAHQNGDEIKINPRDIINLFKVKPSHTKNYEDKLYQYGKYAAITTAGSASINGRIIKKLIDKALKELKPDNKSDIKSISEKVNKLKDFIVKEVKEWLSKKPNIDTTIFILSNYSRSTGKTYIYKLSVVKAQKKDLDNPDFEFVEVVSLPDNMSVICEGQNRLSERLLLGDFNTIFDILPSIVKRVAKDFKIPDDEITSDYLESLLKDGDIVTKETFEDMKIFKLTNLSLQQAVNLANLLMKMEIDFQNYTENIPTVGGVIKLAVIDNDGFRFISGHEIVAHETF